MSVLTLKFKNLEHKRAIARLREHAKPAMARALNRAIGSSRALMSTKIASDTKLKVGVVKENLSVTEARPSVSALFARLEAPLKRIPLIEFNARGPEPSHGRGRGVTARTPSRRYPNAFIATMGSGHRGVFRRRGKDRLPIDELKGPSIGHVFEKYVPEALARGEESLVKNLRHELRFALSK